MSKAFDCVHHELLLIKLEYLGFSKAVIDWFNSYLSNRCHRVFVNNDLFSEWAEIITGVPQGSVLGPLLFLLYLMDLPNIIKNCVHHAYADDLQIYCHFDTYNIEENLQKVQEDVLNVIKFCNSHNLILNVEKTQIIIFGTSQYLNQIYSNGVSPFVINDCVIPYSASVKNLGIFMDSTLSWNEHCAHVIQKVFSILAQLKRNFSFIPYKVRKLLVNTLLFPHIDYAAVVFSDMSVTNNCKLQKLQNSCIRFICGARRCEHVTPFYKELGILKVVDRRTFGIATLIFKIMKTEQPCYLYQNYVFTSNINTRTTRSNKSRMQIPNHRLEKYHNSFYLQSIKNWNDFELYELTKKSQSYVKNYIYKTLLAKM